MSRVLRNPTATIIGELQHRRYKTNKSIRRVSMSSTAAGRAARKTQRNSIIESTKATQRSKSPAVITTDAPDASTASDHVKTIQLQKDEIEELTDAKTRLEDKVTQLEERAQYLEATARLNASKVATEIVDLKEKARKLEIDLSTVVDERDALEQDIEQLKTQRQDAEVKDEARHLSIQLKDAWLKISTMKKSQEELVKKLFNSESTTAQLQADLTKSQDLSATTKREHIDDINRWETERQEYIAEINSFKEKLSESSKDGGEKLLDWEQDKARIRNSFSHERTTWDKEKKSFLDQIASLKVKVTALSVQKTAPPEWILEKHQLVEQCTSLQSRVTTLESERANGVGLGDSSSKKLEVEKLKLEKKVETLKAKLVEVMGHAMSIQAEAQEKIAKRDLSGKKSSNNQRRRSNARKKKRSPARELESDDDVVVVVAEDESDIMQDIETTNAAPTTRETRAKRNAAVKNVNYQILSSSSDQSEESEEDDEEDNDDQEDDEDGDEDIEYDAEGGTDVEEQDGAGDTEMQEIDNETASIDANKTGPSIEHTEPKDSPSSSQLDMSSKDNIDDMNEETEQVRDDNTQSKSASRSRKASVSKSKKANEGSSDSEFEPPKKTVIIKARSRRNVKKSVSPSAEPAPKKAKITPVNKKRSNEGETPESTDNQSVPATKGKSTALGDTPHTTVDSMPDIQPSSPIASEATSSPAIAPSTPVDGEKPTSTEKIKKKRKLLTGKGLEELGDILNGPGSSFSSTPSTGLVFGKGKARLKSASSTLLGGTTSNPANLEALNAIKMAFTLPKPRTDPSTQDKEI
ncbi:hypothetical protein BGX26_007299 [Mortierella sp. AD094]|nr:hypothetical protein BGX26_007299 [Mortierella sp. AD094]